MQMNWEDGWNLDVREGLLEKLSLVFRKWYFDFWKVELREGRKGEGSFTIGFLADLSILISIRWSLIVE
jgi:hypothetical protein